MTAQVLWKLSVICTLVASAGNAEASTVITSATMLGAGSFMPSAHVTITAAANSTNFTAFSQHQNGNNIYFCTDGTLKYYYSTKASGSVVNLSPTPSQPIPSGWSSL